MKRERKREREETHLIRLVDELLSECALCHSNLFGLAFQGGQLVGPSAQTGQLALHSELLRLRRVKLALPLGLALAVLCLYLLHR
jgi:hypothetical protein